MIKVDGLLEKAPKGYSFKYKNNPDGTIGVDYFDPNGTPIANWQFSSGSGADVSQIEKGAQQRYRSFDEYLLDNGGTTSTGQYDRGIGKKPPSDITTPSDTSATSSSPTQSNIQVDSYGNVFDLSNPDQAAKYYQNQQQYTSEIYNQKIKDWQNQWNRSYEDQQNALRDLGFSKRNYQNEYSNYFGDPTQGIKGTLQKSLDELDKTYRGRNTGLINYFANSAPGIYQSAEGDNLAESRNLYNEGTNDLNQNQVQNTNYFEGLQNQLNDTQNIINRNLQDLNQQKTQYPTQLLQEKNNMIGGNYSNLKNWARQNNYTMPSSVKAPEIQSRTPDISGIISQLSTNPYSLSNATNFFASTPQSTLNLQKRMQGIQTGTITPTDKDKELMGIY